MASSRGRDLQMNQRRSSIRNDPQIQQEMSKLIPSEIFKNMAGFQNMTRLSGNTTRGSLNRQRSSSTVEVGSAARGGGKKGPGCSSGIPTPVVVAGGSAKKRSMMAGPPPMRVESSRGRATELNRPGPINRIQKQLQPRSSSANNLNRVGVAFGSGMKPPSGKLERTKSTVALSSTLSNTRKKSMSLEGLSYLQTPRRNQSKSPSSVCASGRKGGVCNVAVEQGKNIKITKDRTVLSEMATYIYDFLKDQDCQAIPAHRNDLITGSKLSVAKTIQIMKFLASHFVGDAFFSQKPKGDDDFEKILEAAKLLKYPGQISKSHLKTANAQHAWPSCVTFIAWLCTMAKALLYPQQQESGIGALTNNGMQEFAQYSYMELFPLYFKGTLGSEQIDEELAAFKARIQEAQGTDVAKSKDELLQEYDEKKAELEKLLNEPDPAKELYERFRSESHVLQDLKQKISEAEANDKKYSDTTHLALQFERIQLEMKSQTAEINRLKQQIESQPISQHDALELKNENQTYKEQLECLKNLISQLLAEFENRSKKKEEFRKDLYELCTAFSVVETYNELVRGFGLDSLLIAPNPFSTDLLQDWMKDASKTLRKAEGAANDIVAHVITGGDKNRKEMMRYTQQILELEKQIEELNLKLQTAENHSTMLTKNCERLYNEKLEELAQVTSVCEFTKKEHNTALESHVNWIKGEKEYIEKLEKAQSRAQELRRCRNKRKQELMLYIAQSQETILRTILDVAKQQQDFFLENANVDIFPGIDLNVNNNTNSNDDDNDTPSA